MVNICGDLQGVWHYTIHLIANNLIRVAFLFFNTILSQAENKADMTGSFSALDVDTHMEGNALFPIFYRIYYVIFVIVNPLGDCMLQWARLIFIIHSNLDIT